MNVELQINDSSDPNSGFVGWAPSPCRIRVTNPAGVPIPGPAPPRLRQGAAGVRVRGERRAAVFRSGTTGAFTNTLDLNVPLSGTTVRFFVAGKFGAPERGQR